MIAIKVAVKTVSDRQGKPTQVYDKSKISFRVQSGLRRYGTAEPATWKLSDTQEVCVRAAGDKTEDTFHGEIVYRTVKKRPKRPKRRYR